jgi:formylglycine-generating enzyme required for sulfatase activity
MKSNYLTKAFTLLLLLWAAGTNANNIQVTINSYDAALKRLNVTLSWDNSWHDGTGTFRDAAWVFVKYKDATMMTWETAPVAVPNPATWQATGNNVRFEALCKNPITTSTAVDYRGLIVRRAKTAGLAISDPTMTGVYNVSMTFNIPFAFAGTPANPEFKIFALEMVDIPQGAFWAGDGSIFSSIKAGATGNAPKNIINEAATTLVANGSSVSLLSTFPKGFNEFYVMKYELSQEGYVEFLNTLSRTEQNNVVFSPAFSSGSGNIPTSAICVNGTFVFPAGSFYPTNTFDIVHTVNARQGIKATAATTSDAAVFYCDLNGNSVMNETSDGQNIPVAPFSVSSILNYLCWAGLAPISELEFEKACRGPVYPVANEFCWGTNTKNEPGTPDVALNTGNEAFSGNFDGPGYTIPSSTTIANTVNFNYSLFRCGVFAKPSGSNRLNSGGSYYGVMDLSNNAWEFTVPVTSIIFSNVHGNGTTNCFVIWPDSGLNKSLRIGGGDNFIGNVSTANAWLNSQFSINTLMGIRGVIR